MVVIELIKKNIDTDYNVIGLLNSEEAVDKHIGAQLQLEVNGEMQHGKVIGRATDSMGDKIGKAHKNPMFDSREFIVKFPDESTRRFTVNQIAQAIHSQVDSEGNQYSLLEEIIGHKKDGSAVPKERGFWISKNGNRIPKRTTRGWTLGFVGSELGGIQILAGKGPVWC